MNIFKNKNKNKAFTVIELIVVIAVIAVLSTIVLVNVNKFVAKARDAKRLQDIKTIQSAIIMYYGKYGSYPNINQAQSNSSSWATLQSALGEWLVVLPVDPTNSGYFRYMYDGGAVGEEYGLMCDLESPNNFSLADNDGGDYNRGNGQYYEIGPDPIKAGNWWTE